MTRTTHFMTSAAAAIVLGVASGVAAADTFEGYAENPTGQIWKNSFGECWQTGQSYSSEKMILECGAKDSDGDGVIDRMDKCPGTPKGTKVDATGCPLDGDGDGVMDDKDACPTTPAGRTVNSLGCQLDGDNDGVYDADDACPNTPAGHTVNAAGCSTITGSVFFDTGKAVISAEGMATLKSIATALSDGGIKSVTATGFADQRGGDTFNMTLSEKRAAAVKAALSGMGVDGGKISTDAKGEVPGDDLAQHRRVDVTGK
ncbi:MAG: OmpA family protein [Gammaproteobacteria bacterium]